MFDKNLNKNVLLICTTALIIFLTIFGYVIIDKQIKNRRIEKCIVEQAKADGKKSYVTGSGSFYMGYYEHYKNFCILKYK